MTNYNIEKIEDGIATLRYPDNSWAKVVLASDMAEADLDDLALQFAPKTGAKPSFISVGDTRTAAAKPEPVVEEVATPAWLAARLKAYDAVEVQVEFITENGLDAWQAKVAQIKADNPKE